MTEWTKGQRIEIEDGVVILPSGDVVQTLDALGTPWAEVYRGSGRLTGQLAKNPIRMQNGDVAPGWKWVGRLTESEFYEEFDHEVHGRFHSANRPDWSCQICEDWGWV